MRMNKVVLLIIIAVLLLAVIAACTVFSSLNQQSGTIIINESKKDSITEQDACTLIKHKEDISARIPFLLILSHLGAEITKEGDKVCIFVCDNLFELNFQKKEVIKRGDWFNILTGLAGYDGNYYCEQKGEDLFLDDLTLRSALDFMGISVTVIIDYDNRMVYINVT